MKLGEGLAARCVCVCMNFMALITPEILCARSKGSVDNVSA